MGRCNNRRAQQAAEALRNTPARARFSKVPTQQRGKKKTTHNKNDNKQHSGNNHSSNQQQQQQNDGRRTTHHGRSSNSSHPQHESVVSKMKQRVQQQPTVTKARTSSTTKLHLSPKQLEQLDEIQLSEEALHRIASILAQLQVVGKQPTPVKEEDTVFPVATGEHTTEEPSTPADHDTTHGDHPVSTDEYAEYEHDWDEEHQAFVSSHEVKEEEQKNTSDNNHHYQQQHTSSSSSDIQQHTSPSSTSKDPVFLKLTKSFSFTPTQATSACRAVQMAWGRTKNHNQPNTHENNGSENTTTASLPTTTIVTTLHRLP